MAWTETARRDYVRRGLRYATDCTDDEWAVVAPLLHPMGKVGRPREHDPHIVERNPIHRDNRLPMGAITEGIPAVYDGAVPFLPDARQRLA